MRYTGRGMDDATRTRLETVVGRLVERLGENLLGIALFGSRARGDGGPESDLDVFVVVRSPESRHGVPLTPPPLPSGPAVSLCVVAEREFLADVAPIDLDLALDGRVLWERDGFLGRHLARLRELIDEAGLYRTPKLFWRWKVPPCRDWSIDWQGVRK